MHKGILFLLIKCMHTEGYHNAQGGIISTDMHAHRIWICLEIE